MSQGRRKERGKRERSHNHFPIRLLIFPPLKDTLQSETHVWTVCQESMAQLYTEELCALAACIWPSRKSDHTQYEKEGWAN